MPRIVPAALATLLTALHPAPAAPQSSSLVSPNGVETQ